MLSAITSGPATRYTWPKSASLFWWWWWQQQQEQQQQQQQKEQKEEEEEEEEEEERYIRFGFHWCKQAQRCVWVEG